MVTVGDADWQLRCLKWADEEIPFELIDAEEAHTLFCEDLCERFGYETCAFIRNGHRVRLFLPTKTG